MRSPITTAALAILQPKSGGKQQKPAAHMDINYKYHGRHQGVQNQPGGLSVPDAEAPQTALLQVWKASFTQNIHQSSPQAKSFPSNTSFN